MTQQTDTLLDLAEAMRFIEINPPTLDCHNMIDIDLSEYKRATPDALEYLGKHGYNGCAELGLDKLDKMTAQALVGWDTFFYFWNLRHLNTEVAGILAGGHNQLCFEGEGLGLISPDVAGELARLPALLHLNLDSISADVANELVRHPHELTLVLKVPPTEKILHILSNHAGYSLGVSWIRRSGDAPCDFSSTNKNKRVFALPRFNDLTEQWHEHVYIGDLDFYPDLPVSEDGRIWEDGVIRLL